MIRKIKSTSTGLAPFLPHPLARTPSPTVYVYFSLTTAAVYLTHDPVSSPAQPMLSYPHPRPHPSLSHCTHASPPFRQP